MKIKYIIGLMFLVIMNQPAAAETVINSAREQVIQRYILDLKNADYKDIIQLFEKNAFVVSTSRGKTDAKEFFYSFLPGIESANTELRQIFASVTDKNRVAARFHFSFKLKDGESGDGEYIDEFRFSVNSAKLSSVYMFENLKFNGE